MLARRPILKITVVAAVALAAASACAPGTRYRLLRFFLDGVPDPDAQPLAGYAPARSAAPTLSAPTRTTPNVPLFAHTPYRQDRCNGCHIPETGGLVRTLEDGLCLNCHAPLIGEVRFAHGPAAVAACTACHHYHASPFANQLLHDIEEVCAQCHETDDLTSGPHHVANEMRACTNCHDPHGGNDRFFLKRIEQ